MSKYWFKLFIIISSCTLIGCTGSASNRYQHLKEAPPPKPIHNINVALVLGSGGARGLAHLGVLEVLEENKIPIDLIVGSSSGSIIGAFYADTPDTKQIKKTLINLTKKDLLDPSIFRLIQGAVSMKGLIQGHALEDFLQNQLKSTQFEDLSIPLVVTATNVKTNQLDVLRSGALAPALRASSSLPPTFTPVNLYSQVYIDGGVMAPVPVQVAKQFNPKMIIAVDISLPPGSHEVDSAFSLAKRAFKMSFYELSQSQANKADIVIHPNFSGYGTFDDEYNEIFYHIGQQAALMQIKAIKEKLQHITASVEDNHTEMVALSEHQPLTEIKE